MADLTSSVNDAYFASNPEVKDFLVQLAKLRAAPPVPPDLILDLWHYIQNVPEIEDGEGFNSLRKRVHEYILAGRIQHAPSHQSK